MMLVISSRVDSRHYPRKPQSPPSKVAFIPASPLFVAKTAFAMGRIGCRG